MSIGNSQKGAAAIALAIALASVAAMHAYIVRQNANTLMASVKHKSSPAEALESALTEMIDCGETVMRAYLPVGYPGTCLNQNKVALYAKSPGIGVVFVGLNGGLVAPLAGKIDLDANGVLDGQVKIKASCGVPDTSGPINRYHFGIDYEVGGVWNKGFTLTCPRDCEGESVGPCLKL